MHSVLREKWKIDQDRLNFSFSFHTVIIQKRLKAILSRTSLLKQKEKARTLFTLLKPFCAPPNFSTLTPLVARKVVYHSHLCGGFSAASIQFKVYALLVPWVRRWYCPKCVGSYDNLLVFLPFCGWLPNCFCHSSIFFCLLPRVSLRFI